MNLRILIDMNLSPGWAPFLQQHGYPSTHWSQIGDPHATDRTIMDWALNHGEVVLTHDLDFGTILALTHATGPSVIQIRGQDVMVDRMGSLVIAALAQHSAESAQGALLVVDQARRRVRILPL
jgi:predicted nuclease of predicted toxin-antitoxin system